jgi:hypothetical protein
MGFGVYRSTWGGGVRTRISLQSFCELVTLKGIITMHFKKPLVLFFFNVALGCMSSDIYFSALLTFRSIAEKCGEADACLGAEFCATATFTAPIATTITTCIPTPTCLGVYRE